MSSLHIMDLNVNLCFKTVMLTTAVYWPINNSINFKTTLQFVVSFMLQLYFQAVQQPFHVRPLST